MSVRVRDAEPGDRETIVGFNASMGRETEGLELPLERLRRGTQALLEDPRRGRYWIAELDGVPVGQIMVTYEWSDWRAADFWWIQSVYTKPEHRGRGVYRALHGHVVALAQRSGAAGVRLYVERHNTGARAVYEKLGMKSGPYEMMEIDFVISR